MQKIGSDYPDRQVSFKYQLDLWGPLNERRADQARPKDETLIQGSKQHIPGQPDLSTDTVSEHPPVW